MTANPPLQAGSAHPDSGNELLVVDSAVGDASLLVSGRRAGMDVLHLAPDRRGLEQIASHLAGRSGITSLHVLSHGEPGALLLAGDRIDLPALAMRRVALAGIASALTEDAEVLLYGCSVAAGPRGRGFLEYLEAALGADVAASVSPVGASTLGGSWTLRGRNGAAVDPAFASSARAAFPGLLASYAMDIFGNGITGTVNDDNFDANAGEFNANDTLNGAGGTDTLNVYGAQGTLTLTATTITNIEIVNITAGVQDITTNDGNVAAGETLTVNASTNSSSVTWNGAAETDGVFSLTGGSGADSLVGGAGADTVSGNSGNDTLRGEAGNDRLFGGTGNDALSGGAGTDTLSGGTGNDLMSGGADFDVLVGGSGNDTFTGSASDHNGDTISDFATGDSIVVTGVDLSSLNGTTASSTLATGSNGITLTGITSASGTFAASFSGGNTTITLVAPVVESGGGTPVVVTDSTSTDTTGGARTITNSGSTPGSAPIVQNTGNNNNVVTATLPGSVSITSEGPATAQTGTEAVTTLVSAIQARGSTGTTGLVSNAQTFLTRLGTTSTLDIRTIVPTQSTGITTDDPIVIAGSTGSSQSEAFVIDMRSISGKVLQIDNIEFASIIGSARVIGGSGNNYAVGDDSAQFISLGEGDDTLYGGDGNDTIGSASGNDALFGDAGNDTVNGGTGADTVWGGTGDDAVYGNQDADVVYGNLGNDVVYGNLGSDTLYGGAGNDLLYGGAGNDTLIGGLGNDTFQGGLGNDLFSTGTGSDVIAISAGNGADTVSDFDGAAGDRVQVASNINGGSIDTFAELQAASTNNADGNVEIALGGGNTLTLMGVNAGQLQSDWFTFV
ncbi:DUF4347 domain-containing protein [Thalassobaculum sp.]|uniref:DUF4347 domain-containing protein n=1 Tax=Thalassobaculum sp. TaxID=2022740 RepID=UPI0032F0551B